MIVLRLIRVGLVFLSLCQSQGGGQGGVRFQMSKFSMECGVLMCGLWYLAMGSSASFRAMGKVSLSKL